MEFDSNIRIELSDDGNLKKYLCDPSDCIADLSWIAPSIEVGFPIV